MSELKEWKPQPGGYGETFRKENQTKIELINDIKIEELSEYSDNNTVTERIEEILKFSKKFKIQKEWFDKEQSKDSWISN